MSEKSYGEGWVQALERNFSKISSKTQKDPRENKEGQPPGSQSSKAIGTARILAGFPAAVLWILHPL